MTSRLLIIAALSLGLGAGVALAQNDQLQPDSAPGAGTVLPAGERGIGETFFIDPATGSLRGEAEVRAGWQELTMDEQTEVRSYCNAVGMASAPPTEELTTGSVTPDATTEVASIERSCGWIAGM